MITTTTAPAGDYGVLTAPLTLKIQRTLPGPIERIWDYLTKSELRRQWLASGDMEMKVGSSFTFTWRNAELADAHETPPAGHSAEHSMECKITELDPPRKLAITWGRSEGVTFTLEPKGKDVLLTVLHRRLPDRQTMLMVSAGWHAHLDVLVARASGRKVASFWDKWSRLKTEYDSRLPA